MREEKDILKKNLGEDTTKYGEFVVSFDKWITPEEQKKKAKKLEDATNVGVGLPDDPCNNYIKKDNERKQEKY